MVNVTWVTPFAPDRSGGGGQIRQAHLLLALAERARIQLVCPGPVTDPDVRAAVARLVEVEPATADGRAKHPWRRRAADLAASVLPRPPIEVRAFAPVRRTLRRALGPALAPFDTDVVLVEFAGLAPLLPGSGRGGRPGRGGTRRGPWVLTLHNLPSRMAAQQVAVMPHRRQRWLLARDAKAAAAFERRVATDFDAVIVCTEEDAARLAGARAGAGAGAGAVPVTVVPNGTDVERFRPTPLPATPRIVFTGALYTTPNIDGAIWFCRQVLPLIRRDEPSVEVDLVGARPVPEVQALGRLPGVRVHPDVATVSPYLEAARVAVVPLRVGSGTRLKALEALASGRPVVGTSIGLEGLGLRPDEHVLVANDAKGFAAAVVRLLRDDDLARGVAAAGRQEVETRFGWPSIGAAFTDLILALADRGGPSPDPVAPLGVSDRGGGPGRW